MSGPTPTGVLLGMEQAGLAPAALRREIIASTERLLTA
jgi:hypothetical protein